MSNQIILNSKNYDSNTQMYVYDLPFQQKFEKSSIALSSMAMYNSFYNISANYGNNLITYTHYANWTKDPYTDAVINTTEYTFNWTIPDGFYSTSDMNYWLHNQFLKYKLYATNGGNNVFFTDMKVNSTIYGNQIDFYLIKNNSYILPVDCGWTWYNDSWKTPALEMSADFGLLFGFSANTYGDTLTNISYTSDIISQINRVNSLILTCNLINNKMSIPTNIFTSVPINGSWGGLITANSNQLIYNKIAPNTYNRIEITVYDQDLNKIKINDLQSTILLSITSQ